MSNWLNWYPTDARITADPRGTEPTKPPEANSVSFGSASHAGNSIVRDSKTAPKSLDSRCPYHLPVGVKLVRFERKAGKVLLAVYSTVEDPDKFIRRGLAELDARLHSPVQIKAGDSVFELLTKLADCGLELRLEWPPEPRTMPESPEREPTKPSKLPRTADVDPQGEGTT